MLSCRVWSPEKFIRDGGRSSVCFDSVAIHDEFYAVLDSSEVLLSATPCRFVSLKKITDIVNLFSLWYGDSCVSSIYLNLVCLDWRDYIPCIASVRLDLDLAMIEFISFSLNNVAVDGRSMISIYVDYGFDVLSLATYPRVGVTTSSMIDVFISICVAHHRQASVR
jgi:hypothetical protein